MEFCSTWVPQYYSLEEDIFLMCVDVCQSASHTGANGLGVVVRKRHILHQRNTQAGHVVKVMISFATDSLETLDQIL